MSTAVAHAKPHRARGGFRSRFCCRVRVSISWAVNGSNRAQELERTRIVALLHTISGIIINCHLIPIEMHIVYVTR